MIAIDGPAGSGKSTVSRALASRLGIDRLDTGAMYRAVAWAALRRRLEPGDRARGGRAGPHPRASRVGERVEADGTDITEDIRGPEVSGAVSAVAANPGVRAVLVERQRAWVAEHGGGVIEGRDIGSVVFPDADVKIYLTASSDERARRRPEEGAECARPVGTAWTAPGRCRPWAWPTGPGSSTPPTGRWRTSWTRC